MYGRANSPAGLTAMMGAPQPPLPSNAPQMMLMGIMQEESAQRAHERHQHQLMMLAFMPR